MAFNYENLLNNVCYLRLFVILRKYNDKIETGTCVSFFRNQGSKDKVFLVTDAS